MLIRKSLLGLVMIFGTVLSSAPVLLAQNDNTRPVYLDPKAPVEERIDDLISRMTLKEKVGQLNLPCVYVEQLGKDIPSKTEACKRFAAGTYTQEIGPGCGFFTLADRDSARGPAATSRVLQRAAENRVDRDAAENTSPGG